MKTAEEIAAARSDLVTAAKSADAAGDADMALVLAAGCAALSWVLSLGTEGEGVFAFLVAQAQDQDQVTPS